MEIRYSERLWGYPVKQETVTFNDPEKGIVTVSLELAVYYVELENGDIIHVWMNEDYPCYYEIIC